MSVLCRTLLVVSIAGAVAGCGDATTARFAENSAMTKQLMPKARRAIQKSLEENFGTPLQTVAWLRLPVNYGNVEGTVKSASGQSISVEFNRAASDLESLRSPDMNGAVMLFSSGSAAGKQIRLAAFEPKNNAFTTFASLDAPPAAGDGFVAAGHLLKQGRKLYARHCQHCHGVSGDGDGPTAKYLNPRPRDYRLGIFKFTSTLSFPVPIKVSREDLSRVIGQGIPGTYMPAFVPMLKPLELNALVEYVRWLAMRGEIERLMITEMAGDYSRSRANDDGIDEALDKFIKDDLPSKSDEFATEVAEKWTACEDKLKIVLPRDKQGKLVPRTPDSPESRRKGRELYLDKKGAKCVDCHGNTGRGNGVMTESFNEDRATKKIAKAPGLFDDWGNSLKPRDLTRGIYRGGRRPIDIYRRISAGIKGTPMPGQSEALTPEQIWDLVNYVLSIPFESPAPKASPTSVASTPAERGHE